MLKKIARRIKTYLVGDILRELAAIKSRLDLLESLESLETLPALSKTLETALLSLALHADHNATHNAPHNAPAAEAIAAHTSPSISQSPSA